MRKIAPWIRRAALIAWLFGCLPAIFGIELGDPARSLAVSRWITGNPVDLSTGKGKNLYVIVFWETTCPVCLSTLQYLSEFQTRFKDQGVVLIAVSDEPVDTITNFLGTTKGVVKFVVAADDDHKTLNTYMTASGKGVIPYSFVVDKDGNIAWSGHPLAGLSETVQELLEGRFDIQAAKRIASAEKLQQQYFLTVTGEQDASAARGIGRQIISDGGKSPWLMNNFAWRVFADPKIKARDLQLGLEAAKAACELTKWTNSAFLDTYARGLFDSGKVDDAIKTEKTAVQMSSDDAERAALRATLVTYEGKAKK